RSTACPRPCPGRRPRPRASRLPSGARLRPQALLESPSLRNSPTRTRCPFPATWEQMEQDRRILLTRYFVHRRDFRRRGSLRPYITLSEVETRAAPPNP